MTASRGATAVWVLLLGSLLLVVCVGPVIVLAGALIRRCDRIKARRGFQAKLLTGESPVPRKEEHD